MKPEQLSDEEIDQRIEKFRKTVRYRKFAGMVLAGVGLMISVIGLGTTGDFFLRINGGFCLAYGIYMYWQSAKCEGKLRAPGAD